MDEMSQVQTEPLNHSEAAVSFPPHRRRPLLSRTYRTLIGILSHCRTTSPQLQTQVESGHAESRPVYEENISITDVRTATADLLVPLANSKDPGSVLVQETNICENKENFGLQEGASSDKHVAGSKLDYINRTQNEEQEIAQASSSGVVDLLAVENKNNECAIQIFKEQEVANSIGDIQMDNMGALEQIEVDKEFSVSDFSEILDSCFGMDVAIQSSDAVEKSHKNGTVLDDDTHINSEHELQLKEMELEKLIYNSGVAEPTSCPNINDDIEEGEISGDFGHIDASLDVLSEDAVSLEVKTEERVHASQASLDKEEYICDGEDSGHMQYEMADPPLTGKVNSEHNSMQVETKTTAGQMQDCHLNIVVCGRTGGAENGGFIGPCLADGTPDDKITQQNAAENQMSESNVKDGDMKTKKRKRGPLTKEKRAKKKKKERIKRAEKNRELGTKRLKLPPVVKQKKIVYCRHYLQGRCHEGEKCNFSHDTVPLTKSKPCGHFARHSCMKGDDCPFDHELSKYPCNNYATNGFCSRGSDCLFSHEMPANQSPSVAPNISKPECTSVQIKEGSLTTSKVTKPEAKLLSPLNNSNSSKVTDKHGLFSQKTDSKSCSAGNSPHQSTIPASRTVKAPKGVSFLLNGGISLGESSGSKSGLSLRTSESVDVAGKTTRGLGSGNKLNDVSEKGTLKKPRGINFLSFAQPPSDHSTSKMFSNLLSNHNIETGKSVVEDASEGKLTDSLLKSVGTLKVNRQMNQSASCLVPVANENVNGAPMTVPQHIDFSPVDEILSHVSKNQGSLLPNEGNADLSFVKERQGTSSQPHNSTKIPSLSSSGPGDQSATQKNANLSRSFKTSYLSNAPSSVQKAVQSTIAFAAKFEPAIKVGSSLRQGGS